MTIMQSMSKKSPQIQRGISLFVVIVIVMLSALLAMWGSRTSLFNEMIVGNDADYQRAFEAAQALVQDAEFDIRGERPDGTACVPAAGKPEVCRVPDAVVNKVWIPTEDKEIGDILSELDGATTKYLTLIFFLSIIFTKYKLHEYLPQRATCRKHVDHGIPPLCPK